MVGDSVITDEIRGLIGTEQGPLVFEIEKTMIMKAAQAMEDPNPLWQNEDYAKRTRYGSIIAPPTFIFCLGLQDCLKPYIYAQCPLKATVAGDVEIEYYRPIRPGDQISCTLKLENVEERQSKKRGKLLLMFLTATYENQNREVVARLRNTVLRI